MNKKALITSAIALFIFSSIIYRVNNVSDSIAADETSKSVDTNDDSDDIEDKDSSSSESVGADEDSESNDTEEEDTKDNTDNKVESDEDDMDSESSESSSKNSTNKSVSLSSFAENPEPYAGGNIRTTGTVTYIQKKPNDENMYYVVIAPRDEHTTSGYSEGHGTVVEVNVDIMSESPVHEGDTITVNGGALTQVAQISGKTIRSGIIADSIEKT